MNKHHWVWDRLVETYHCWVCESETKYRGSKNWDSKCQRDTPIANTQTPDEGAESPVEHAKNVPRGTLSY